MREVYLDHAATTPPFPEVIKTIQEAYTTLYGNASSLHSTGQKARQALEKAREEIAKTINADSEEIYFTSGGTESDNLALFGTESLHPSQPVVTSLIEHEAVLESVNALESKGHPARFLPVNLEGIVDLNVLKTFLEENPYVVSVMVANNEIGTIQPLREIAALAHEKGALVHTDAVQALGKITVDVQELGVDMLSASAHKFYGPKGIGFFYLGKGVKALPLFQGGGARARVAIRNGKCTRRDCYGFGAENSNAIVHPYALSIRTMDSSNPQEMRRDRRFPFEWSPQTPRARFVKPEFSAYQRGSADGAAGSEWYRGFDGFGMSIPFR